MAERIQLRRGLASTWTSVNSILAQGEIGIELDTYKFKWGNGVDDWNSLSYFGGGVSISDVTGLTAALAGKVDDSQITAFMLTLLDDPDAATARATLGLGTAATTASTAYAPAAHVGSGGAEHAVATGATAGFMSETDKTKLNGIGAGASVSTVSVATANGFAGTVATPGTTPAITMTVTFSGLAKANGTSLSAATAGTDYSLGTSALGTGILKSTTGTGALTVAAPGDFPVLNQNTTGTAASVTGTNVVANTNLAQMPANTFKANNTGATANAADITVAQAKTMLAITAADVSGLGALATQTTVNLSTQATGVLQAAQEPAHTGDVTNTAGSLALTIGAGVVTNAKLATVATATFKGRTTAGTGAPEDLTPAQAKTLLAIVAADLSDFAATVRATVLTGVSFATNAAITATDSVLVAFGKLQAQITGHFGVGGTTHPDVVAAGLSGFMSGADKTKLNGIATGATVNSPDATLLARANHTGNQVLATISDVTITAANVNALDDGVNTALHFHDADRARANHTGTQTAATISDFSTAADARIAASVLDAHADVVITTPSTGQVLKFNGTNWINDVDATGGGGVTDGDKGDITVSGAGTVWTIDPATVTLAKMAALAATSIIGNNTGAGATPIALTPAQVKTLLAIASTDVSGLGTLATASTVNLSTQATGALQAAQFPAQTGDVTNTAGALATTITAGSVTLPKMANLAVNSIIGNNTGAGAVPLALTPTQVTAMLDAFTSVLKGLVPASGGGTANFLRADGTWATPAGGGGLTYAKARSLTSLRV